MNNLCKVVIASFITYLLASIAHSQYVIGKIESMGVDVVWNDRLWMTLTDVRGLYAYAIVITVGLFTAWSVMAVVQRMSGASRWLLYPLGGLLAMAAIMAAMALVFPMILIAPARDAVGIAGQCAAGLVGGIVLAWLNRHSGRSLSE